MLKTILFGPEKYSPRLCFPKKFPTLPLPLCALINFSLFLRKTWKSIMVLVRKILTEMCRQWDSGYIPSTVTLLQIVLYVWIRRAKIIQFCCETFLLFRTPCLIHLTVFSNSLAYWRPKSMQSLFSLEWQNAYVMKNIARITL